jgi:hypothetical protein
MSNLLGLPDEGSRAHLERLGQTGVEDDMAQTIANDHCMGHLCTSCVVDVN